MIIGGYAVGVYGHIRATSDLDIFIHAQEENANKMIKACLDYGIPENLLSKEIFLVEKMIGIGEPPLRIELLKKLDVIDFRYAFQRVKKINIDSIPVNVISLDDLIVLKKAAMKERNKARDSEDVFYLEKIKKNL